MRPAAPDGRSARSVGGGWQHDRVAGSGGYEAALTALTAAAEAGSLLDLTGADRPIPADAVRALCRLPADRLDPRGLRVCGAVVDGQLDLRNVSLAVPLLFERCEFSDPPLLELATLPALSLRECRLPGLLANGLTVAGDLDLSGAVVEGAEKTSASFSRRAAIWLCESSVGGRLLLVGTVIRAPQGCRALQADRMRVGGTARLLEDFEAHGEVRLLGVEVGGSVDLTGARITDHADGIAVELSDAVIGGNLYLIPSQGGRPPRLEGRLDLSGARVSGQMLVRSAELVSGPGRPGGYHRLERPAAALTGAGLVVDGDVTFEGGCHVTGGLDLTGCEAATVRLDGGTRIEAPGAAALDLSGARLRSGLECAPGLQARGSLRLVDAHLGGLCVLRGTSWSDPMSTSVIAAHGAVVDGEAHLEGLRATGQVSFRSAAISGGLDLTGAHVSAGVHPTVSLHHATVGRSVRLTDGFVSEGVVVLNRAVVQGRLDLRGGTFRCAAPSDANPSGVALSAVAASVRGGMRLGWAQVPPGVDLTGATTTALEDDPDRWPATFSVSGFTYDRFEDAGGAGRDVWDWRARVRWLRGQATFESGPYEQLASVFRRHGYALEAEQVLIALRADAQRAQRRRRRGQSLLRRAWGTLHDAWELLLRALVGHGYRPGRVLWILVALTLVVGGTFRLPAARAAMRATDPQGTVYSVDGPLSPPPPGTPGGACGGGAVRCFDAAFFAVDTVVPLVSLGQRATWYPDEGTSQGRLLAWWLTVANLLGWLLSSVFVLSFARLGRSGAP